MALHGRPLALDDAEHHGVAITAVARNLVITQHAVLLGAQPQNRLARRVIEPMGAEFDRDALQRFEGMGQEQELALGIDGATLHTLRVPGVANLEPAVRRIDVEIARATDDLPGRSEAHDKGHGAVELAHRQRAVDVLSRAIRRGYGGVPQAPEFAVGSRELERVLVPARKRLERRVAPLERNRLDECHQRPDRAMNATRSNRCTSCSFLSSAPYNGGITTFLS